MKNTLQKRFTLILIVQLVVILLLLFYYYNASLTSINQTTHDNASLSAQGLLSEISGEFEYMKAVCGVIAGSDYIRDFLTEKNTSAYYEKAITVSEIIDKTAFPISSSDSIITINVSGEYYRFSGGISNAACEKLYKTFEGSGTVYTIIELDQISYFCHNSPVLSAGKYSPSHMGNVIMLTDLSKIRRLLEKGSGGDLDLFVLADNRVLLSSITELEGKRGDEIGMLYEEIIFADMESGGMVIGAAIGGDRAIKEKERFVFLSLVITGLMLAVIFAIYGYISKDFVSPMSSIMNTVHTINDGNSRLSPTKHRDFNVLAAEINEMLDRTQRYHMGLLGRQINTHFIINMLMHIEGLSNSGENEKAGVALGELIKLIRHMSAGDSNVNIFAEMEFVESYISLMNIKHNGKFTIDYDVHDQLSEYLMPSFILQPIVENALTHGMGTKERDCKLFITGTLEADGVLLKIIDNGAGMSREQLQKLNRKILKAEKSEYPQNQIHGVALTNIQKRLCTLYGTRYGITVHSFDGEGTTVTVWLPLQKDL